MATPPFTSVSVARIKPASSTREDDLVAREEPLEIRVAGDPVAVTMRTPGNDRELALGFLFAEGVITSARDVGSVAHCGRTGDPGRDNVIDILPGPGVVLDIEKTAAARRGTLTTSACGVCGRRSIDDLLARCTPVRPRARAVSLATILAARDALTRTQPLFAKTGGCHGAALARDDGTHVATFEDVGRHNAVDKLVGAVRILRGEDLAEHVMVVSGRTSFEIVQKAVTAGIGVVAGVSAPSSLAVDLAVRAGVTLAGFVRGECLTVYAGVASP